MRPLKHNPKAMRQWMSLGVVLVLVSSAGIDLPYSWGWVAEWSLRFTQCLFSAIAGLWFFKFALDAQLEANGGWIQWRTPDAD